MKEKRPYYINPKKNWCISYPFIYTNIAKLLMTLYNCMFFMSIWSDFGKISSKNEAKVPRNSQY